MIKFLKGLFGVIVFFVLIAVIGKIFIFDIARTDSYSMIPNLIPGDTFLVYTRATLDPGDIAVCRNPADPKNMLVLRVLAVPGSEISMKNNNLYIDGNKVDQRIFESLVYEDNTSGEHIEYLVNIVGEYVGGLNYRVALMDRAGDKHFAREEVEDGLFLIGDNRNRARDSRHFGEVAIEDCVGKAFLIVWPGENSGDLEQKHRFLEWL